MFPLLYSLLFASTAAPSSVSLTEHYGVPRSTLLSALTQIATPLESYDAVQVSKNLSKAYTFHAYFKPRPAFALWKNITRQYPLYIHWSDTQVAHAAEAYYEQAAAHFADGAFAQCKKMALQAVRRFPLHTPTTRTHAPKIIALFTRARAELAKKPCTTLTVQSPVEGTLLIDGHPPQPFHHALQTCLPEGDYVLWLRTAEHVSFPQAITLTHTPLTLRMYPETDARIETTPSDLVLHCTHTCEEDLNNITQRTGLTPRPSPPPAVLATPVHVLAAAPKTTQATHPFLLWMPGGLAQHAQKRPLAGWLWTTSTAGLAAWHISAWVRHTHNQQEHTRYERNISAGLVYSALLLAPLEAWLYQRFFSPPTQPETQAPQAPSW
jgi:hypothetical protein